MYLNLSKNNQAEAWALLSSRGFVVCYLEFLVACVGFFLSHHHSIDS
jgi:hypothetical protein